MTKPSQEEIEALERCRAGARDAFEIIVRKYQKEAYYIALGLVGNRDDALELSQEAFVRAFLHLKRLEKTASFFPWFYHILRNLCFSHLRKRKRRRLHTVENIEAHNPPTPDGSIFDPAAVAEADEDRSRVWGAIEKLDEIHREVIILRHFRNMSYEQMSRVLLCKKGTITSRLYYARKRLKELLVQRKEGSVYA